MFVATGGIGGAAAPSVTAALSVEGSVRAVPRRCWLLIISHDGARLGETGAACRHRRRIHGLHD